MVFLSENAAMPPGQQVKVHKSASFVDILEVCKFTTFCDRKGYRVPRGGRPRLIIHEYAVTLKAGVVTAGWVIAKSGLVAIGLMALWLLALASRNSEV